MAGESIGSAYVEVKPQLSSNFAQSLESQGETGGASFGKGFSGKMQAAFGAGQVFLGNMLANLAAQAVNALGQFIGDSVQVGMQFDSAMSQVAATMGTTVDQIGDLSAFAQEMGSTTAFSATQAAEALNYMALAGYNTEQSMQQLPNVLNLAAAGSIDLARASDMVTDAQSALGLSFDEMEGFVDQLAKTASTTNTSVEQLGDAILTVGGTAKTLSGGTRELNQVLGLLADNGIKGAEGGTALRNMLLSLSAPTGAAAEQLNELGVSVFDAEGNMRSMQDIIGDLNAAMDGMTDEERINAISNIFNARDLKSVNALLGTSAERWNEVGSAIDSAQGAAADMANTQLDNLAGDVTLFQSALEGLQIEIFHGVEPALRGFVSAATEGLTFLTEQLPSIASGFEDFFFGTETQYDEFGTAIGETSTGVFSGMSEAFDNVMAIAQTVWPDIQNIIGGAIDIIVAVAQVAWPVISQMVVTATEIIRGIVETVWPVVSAVITTAIDVIKGAIDGLQPIVNTVMAIFNGIKSAMEDPINTAKNIIQGAIDTIKGLFNFQIQWPHIPLPHFSVSGSPNPLDWLTQGVPQISISWYAEGGFVDGATLIGAGEKGAEMILPKSGRLMEEFAESITEHMGGGTNVYIDGARVNDDAEIKAAFLDFMETLNRKALQYVG